MQTNYPLRARSVCGDYLVPFTLEDGPMKLTEKTFCLNQRPGSHILTYESVCRGSDIEGLFAGDFIRTKDGMYLVEYSKGMFGAPVNKGSKLFFDDGNYSYVSNIYYRGGNLSFKETDQLYKVNNIEFNLSHMFGIHGGLLYVNKCNLKVNPKEIRQYTGTRLPSHGLLYFGEFDATLRNGQLIIQKDNKEFNLTRGDRI